MCPLTAITNVKKNCIESKLYWKDAKLLNGTSTPTSETRFIAVITHKKPTQGRK